MMQGRVHGRDHLAELLTIGPAIGRPDLTLSSAQFDVTAETAPALIAQHFGAVSVERYTCDLEVPAADPVLDYLDSLTDQALTPQQRSAAHSLVRTQIDAHGIYSIRKHTVLITVRKLLQRRSDLRGPNR